MYFCSREHYTTRLSCNTTVKIGISGKERLGVGLEKLLKMLRPIPVDNQGRDPLVGCPEDLVPETFVWTPEVATSRVGEDGSLR